MFLQNCTNKHATTGEEQKKKKKKTIKAMIAHDNEQVVFIADQ